MLAFQVFATPAVLASGCTDVLGRWLHFRTSHDYPAAFHDYLEL